MAASLSRNASERRSAALDRMVMGKRVRGWADYLLRTMPTAERRPQGFSGKHPGDAVAQLGSPELEQRRQLRCRLGRRLIRLGQEIEHLEDEAVRAVAPPVRHKRR